MKVSAWTGLTSLGALALYFRFCVLFVPGGTLHGAKEISDVLDHIVRREEHLPTNCFINYTMNSMKVLTLPMGIRIAPALSPLHSVLPDSFLIYPAMSSVTVPRRSEGMRPFGPSIRPNLGVIARMRADEQSTVVAWCLPLMTWRSARQFNKIEIASGWNRTYTIY
jgi:hypothetical protein